MLKSILLTSLLALSSVVQVHAQSATNTHLGVPREQIITLIADLDYDTRQVKGWDEFLGDGLTRHIFGDYLPPDGYSLMITDMDIGCDASVFSAPGGWYDLQIRAINEKLAKNVVVFSKYFYYSANDPLSSLLFNRSFAGGLVIPSGYRMSLFERHPNKGHILSHAFINGYLIAN